MPWAISCDPGPHGLHPDDPGRHRPRRDRGNGAGGLPSAPPRRPLAADRRGHDLAGLITSRRRERHLQIADRRLAPGGPGRHPGSARTRVRARWHCQVPTQVPDLARWHIQVPAPVPILERPRPSSAKSRVRAARRHIQVPTQVPAQVPNLERLCPTLVSSRVRAARRHHQVPTQVPAQVPILERLRPTLVSSRVRAARRHHQVPTQVPDLERLCDQVSLWSAIAPVDRHPNMEEEAASVEIPGFGSLRDDHGPSDSGVEAGAASRRLEDLAQRLVAPAEEPRDGVLDPGEACGGMVCG